MKTVTYKEFGTPEQVVQVGSMEQPQPQSGQVRVRMVLSPVHNHDIQTIRGQYGLKPDLPAVGGTEALGVVDAVGEGVAQVKAGDRVSIARAQGAWAEYFIADAQHLVPVPDGIADEIAAQLGSMPFSAVLAVNELQADAGDWIVINAANGAVGKTIIQVARNRGLNVVALVRSNGSLEDVQALKLDTVFATNQEGWQDQVREAVGDGRVAGAVDMVGGEAAGDLLGLLSERGVLLSFGAMADWKLHLSIGDLIFKEAVVKGLWASKIVPRMRPEEIKAVFEELIGLASQDKLFLPVDQVFPLDKATEAMHAYEGHRKGKILFQAT